MENIDLGITLIGSDYRIIMSNPAQGDLFRKPASELVGKECFREFEKREAVCPHCPGTIAMATGEKAEAETRGGRDDGSNFAVRVQAFPQFGPDGQTIGFIEVVEDITQRKQVEKALEAERLILRDILEATLAGYWDWDITNNQIYLSPTFKKMFGYEVHELSNSPESWKNLIFPEDLPGVLDIFKKHVESRGAVPYYNEVRYRHKDGSTIWVICAGRVIEWDAAGQPLRMVGCHVDITERKQAEAALLESEKRFRDVAENAQEWVWEVDPQGKYTYVSPIVEKLLGYKPEEVLDKHFYDLFLPEEREKLKKIAFAAFAAKQPFSEFINRNLHKDGSVVWLSTSGVPILDKTGNLLGYRGADINITERRKSLVRLEGINQLKEDLLLSPRFTERLKHVTDRVVEIFAADFARIWITKPGDLCDSGCLHAGTPEASAICRSRDQCLHLVASSGRYTDIDSASHRRVPLGCYKIGRVATGEANKFLTNDVSRDPQIHDHEWAGSLGLAAFAGYRLLSPEKKVLGVLALFSKHPISSEEDAMLEGIAGTTARVIQMGGAEEALRQSEGKFRLLYDNAPLGYQSLDEDGLIIEVNQTWLDILGYAREEVIGRWIGDFLTPEYADHFLKQFPCFKEMGEICDLPFEMVRRDGTIITASFNGKIAYDAQGQFISTHCMFQDITARKRVENIMQVRLRLLEFANSHSMDELLTATLDEIETLTGSNIGFYHFLEADQKTLSLQSWSTNTRKHMCSAAGKGSHYNVARAGVWVDCVHEGHPVIHNDYASLAQRKGMPEGHAPVVREVVVPIFRGKQIKAIIGVGNKLTGYNDSDLEIVSQLGDLSWDIVESKRAEEALRESEERFRDLYENAPNAYFSIGMDGLIRRCNRRAGELLGYAVEELVGRPVLELYADTAHGKEKAAQVLQRLRASETVRDEELEMKKADGNPVWISLTVDAVQDAQGRAVESRSMVVDITERKRAERLRAEQFRFLQLLIDTIPIPIFYKDVNGVYLGCNQSLADFLGMPKEEIIGKTVFDTYPQEQAEKYFQMDQELFQHPGTQIYEFMMERSDGAIRNFIFSKATFIESSGKVAGLIGVMTDITERKQAEEERLAHFRFFENMDRVNRAIQGTTDLEQMMSDVLDVVQAIFGCDRAWLFYPCDPEASSWQVPMERTRPGYPGAYSLGIEFPMAADAAKVLRTMLASSGPVIFGPGSEHPLPAELAQRFGFQSLIQLTLHPKVGKPWVFGMHQCSYPRVWTPEEERLLQAVGRRVADALTSLLMYRDLRESEQKYRLLVKQIPAVVYKGYADGSVDFFDDKIEVLTGYPKEDFDSRRLKWPDLIIPEDQPGAKAKLIVALKTNRSYMREYRIRKKSGDTGWIQAMGHIFLDAAGQIDSISGVFFDITARKQAEEALQDSETRYHAIVEGFDGLIYTCSQNYRVEFMNYKFISRTGHDATGELCYQALHERDSICPWCVNEQVFKGETVRWEVKSPKDDRWYYIVNTPIYHSDGSMSKQSMIHDITERKRAEEALRRAHETLRATLDAAPVAIFDLDTEGRVKSLWNAAAEQMLGWRRDEVLGHYLPSVPEDSQEEFARFRQWVRSGKPIMGKDVVRRRKDGSMIEYSIYAAPEYDDHGKVSGNIAVLVDITERKRAEEAIKLNEARLAGLLRISQYQAESIQDLLNYALEEAIALTTSKIGFIYFYDDASQQFILNTWSREVRERTKAEPQAICQLEDAGIWGETVRQARPIVVNDFLASHPHMEGYPAGSALHKFLAIPIFANKRIVAVVGVANKATDYDAADVLQLTLMMDAVWKIVGRRQAAEELQAAAHKWRTTFDAITDAVFLLDPEGTILQCNQALADLVQKPFTDILGRPCCEVVHGASHPIPDCPLLRIRETKQREEILLPMGDRWYKVGVDPILDEAGNLTGVVHIISDVTQLTETERSLYRRTQDLMMMNTIGSIVSRSLDLHKVIEDSLRMIQHNMFDGQSRSIIFLLDEATGELKVAGHRGFPEDHPCLGRPLKVGKCLCGRAALNGETAVSLQGCADCTPGFLAPPDTAPLQDIGLPLKVRDRLLGVMHLSLSPDQTVDERHLKLLEAIADQISVAVEKARLFEKVNLQGTQLRNLSARLAEIEEAERKVLARELHDQVGQSLTTLSLCLTMLQEQLPRIMPEKAQSRLTDALTLVEETADSVREIMAELRPPVLDDFGLLAAARWFGKQFSKRTGISLQATGEDPQPRLDRKVEMGLFRIIQEALNNVAKHARASQVTVTEEVLGDRVRLTIADNGIGFDVSQVGHPEGRHRWGLMNMSERALAAGGTCRIDSQPGQGTRVIVEVNQ